MRGITLPPLDLTGATLGSKSTTPYSLANAITSNAPGLGIPNPPHLRIMNDSPCGLRLTFNPSGVKEEIPPGGWGILELVNDDSEFSWEVIVFLGASVSNLVYLKYYGPGIEPEQPIVLGNSPINGSVVVPTTTAAFLEGTGQTLPLTEIDDGTGNPILAPANGVGQALFLGARDLANALKVIAEISANGAINLQVLNGSGGFGSIEGSDYYLLGAVKQINSIFTVGKFGVPAIVFEQRVNGITSTALQTIGTYTPPADGRFVLMASCRVNNGTSGQLLTVAAQFTAAFNNVVRGISCQLLSNNTSGLAGGGVSFPNSEYSGISGQFFAKGGTVITMTYRDPANTPNDDVFYTLLQVG